MTITSPEERAWLAEVIARAADPDSALRILSTLGILKRQVEDLYREAFKPGQWVEEIARPLADLLVASNEYDKADCHALSLHLEHQRARDVTTYCFARARIEDLLPPGADPAAAGSGERYRTEYLEARAKEAEIERRYREAAAAAATAHEALQSVRARVLGAGPEAQR